MGEQRLFLALPVSRHRAGQDADKIRLPVRPTGRGWIKCVRASCSAAVWNFNRLFVAALNARPEFAATHWAMWHDDIDAPADWADTLIDEMDRTGADVMSAAVAIKDKRGLTSTGIRDTEAGTTRRLTLTEIHGLPKTFGRAELVRAGYVESADQVLAVNTGLWVCRFDRPWVDQFPGFRQVDGVARDHTGRAHALFLPEDWAFSEWAAKRGLEVMATRKVVTVHRGDDGTEYTTAHAWGDWQTDRGDAQP